MKGYYEKKLKLLKEKENPLKPEKIDQPGTLIFPGNEEEQNKLISEGIARLATFEEIEKDELEELERTPKTEITLPGSGKLISVFIKEALPVLKDKNLFYKTDSKTIVEIEKIREKKESKDYYIGFQEVNSNRFITFLENYIKPGISGYDNNAKMQTFINKSINSNQSAIILNSANFQKGLPAINRIFTVPIPIMHEGKLTFPKPGYDERFNSWLPKESPEITKENMSLEEAKEIIHYIMKEFCFQEKQDFTVAIAGLLTPFLHGLLPKFNTRTPVVVYTANREGIGKDYLAGITGIVYEGYPLEETPLNTSENKHENNNTDELRKKIISAMIKGKKRMHFSNNKGYIDNAVFEQITTAENCSDRILGKSEMLQFKNEIDFSLSGNTGIGFTADLARRCIFSRLFWDEENINERHFKNPNLQAWVLENREQILSALYALVRNWNEKGQPDGKKPFTSFSQWAKICGGIMETAGYESPCEPNKDMLALGGDNETQDIGRTLSGIQLSVNDAKARGSRQEFKFTKQRSILFEISQKDGHSEDIQG